MAPKLDNNNDDIKVDPIPEGNGSFTPNPETNTSEIWNPSEGGPENTDGAPLPEKTVSFEEHQKMSSSNNISEEEAGHLFDMHGQDDGYEDDLPFGFDNNSDQQQGYYEDLDQNIDQVIEEQADLSNTNEESLDEVVEQEAENNSTLDDDPSNDDNNIADDIAKKPELTEEQKLIKKALIASAAKSEKQALKDEKEQLKQNAVEEISQASAPTPPRGSVDSTQPTGAANNSKTTPKPNPELVAKHEASLEDIKRSNLEAVKRFESGEYDEPELDEGVEADADAKQDVAVTEKNKQVNKNKKSNKRNTNRNSQKRAGNKKNTAKKPYSANAKKQPVHTASTSNDFLASDSNNPAPSAINAGTINSIPLSAAPKRDVVEAPKSKYASDSMHQAKIITFPKSKRIGVQENSPSPYNPRKITINSLSVNDQTFGQKFSAADRQPSATQNTVATPTNDAAQNVTERNKEHPNHPDNINKPVNNAPQQNMPSNAPQAGGAQAAAPRGNGVVITIPFGEAVDSLANSIKGTMDAGANTRDFLGRGVSKSVAAFHNSRTKWMDRKSPKVNIFNDLPATSPMRDLPPLAQADLNKAYVSKNSVDRAITSMNDPRYSKGQKKSRAFDMNDKFRSYADSSSELTRILQTDKSINAQTLEATNNYLDGMNKKMGGRADVARNNGWLDSKNKSSLKDRLESVQNAVENIKQTVQRLTSAISALTSRRRP